uniref:NADH-ubiquinone oxidoreductase chain 1 n=1 Tax=Pseudoniphargus stocki TaxID=2211535 RepID=A0A345K5T8_9CRUS|nr:NADH dehydrogenase subunit 1 [Pseudoniphargus stocki]AXH38230.1 NADH dehydrogenase subunit 1 [Pseudoniphargus stocki]
MEYLKIVFSYMVLVILVLVSVAFVTLMEQKILAGSQIRVGPNFVGVWGILQPFSDAVKLFVKEGLVLVSANFLVYWVSPVISLCLALFLWVIYPFLEGGMSLSYGLLLFICVSSLSVFPILGSGWASNCKYSMLGSLRSVAQMVSYEISLAMIILSIVWLSGSFNLSNIVFSQVYIFNFFLFFPLSLIWFASSLAETNRSPYDFSEGESELVSGFNTEYSAGGFVFIFMSEYSNILFMGLLFVIFFGGSAVSWIFILKMMIIVYMFVWVRATMPRYRYDKLMYLAWKGFLPISLMLFIFYLSVLTLCL